MAVSYERASGYPKSNLGNAYSMGVHQVTDKLYCAWADGYALAAELLDPANGANIAVYTIGSGFPSLYAKTVSVEGVGFDTVNLRPTKAALTVTYGKLDRAVIRRKIGHYLVSESIAPAVEFMTLKSLGYKWANGDDVEEIEAPSLLVRMIEWVYTVAGHTEVPSWIWTHIGKVNAEDTVSDELGKTFAAGTLLCGNPSLSINYETGSARWEITTRLTYKEGMWNKFPTSVNGQIEMQSMYKSGVEQEFYKTANFEDIIIR